jgi:hypothetical protein
MRQVFHHSPKENAEHGQEERDMSDKTGDFLRITVPWGQKQAHHVRLKGNFDADWGMEVQTPNPNGPGLDRLKNLSLTSDTFDLESLYLNATGYSILIKLNDPHYTVEEATAVTRFERVTASFASSEKGAIFITEQERDTKTDTKTVLLQVMR